MGVRLLWTHFVEGAQAGLVVMETQTRRGVGGVRSVGGLVEVAALVVHAAALELAEQVEEAVLIRGLSTQLLVTEHKNKNDFVIEHFVIATSF